MSCALCKGVPSVAVIRLLNGSEIEVPHLCAGEPLPPGKRYILTPPEPLILRPREPLQ